ncbi:hypothetical protein SDC9_166419 [bioreactor metagenome]|uniref:Uncharacterized protein n=1 Tax=bioreactor metagenome TaxID=1076179 RepID=A0A645G4V1_9ZZZZ
MLDDEPPVGFGLDHLDDFIDGVGLLVVGGRRNVGPLKRIDLVVRRGCGGGGAAGRGCGGGGCRAAAAAGEQDAEDTSQCQN